MKLLLFITLISMVLASELSANTDFGSDELIQAGDTDMQVPGYSVPSYVDWNSDSLFDIVVGEGSGIDTARVRVYLNCGYTFIPQFSDFFYAQSDGTNLTARGSGCLGLFPRVVYWDGDAKKDLLVGHGGGAVKIYLNTGSNANPVFDAGTTLQWGQPGLKQNINTGDRPTPSVVDWNTDGKKDLVMGNRDSKVYIFINEGTDTEPDFRTKTTAKLGSGDLVVPGYRSSPDVCDLNNDGKKDLVCGNTDGTVLYYENTNTDSHAVFTAYEPLTTLGVPINLPGALRSRPFMCNWNGDQFTDMLVGYGDGKVHFYRGVPEPVIGMAGILGLLTTLIRRKLS
jgi:hypothetical protein